MNPWGFLHLVIRSFVGVTQVTPTAIQREPFSLAHPSGLVISQSLRISEVSAIPGVKWRDMKTGYEWYYLPRAEIAGKTISMGICFFHGKFVHLVVHLIDDKLYPDPFSGLATRETEAARVEAIAHWLADVGYPVGTYTWG